MARFDGSDTTSDAGAILLLAADRRLGLTRGLAACFADHRALHGAGRPRILA